MTTRRTVRVKDLRGVMHRPDWTAPAGSNAAGIYTPTVTLAEKAHQIHLEFAGIAEAQERLSVLVDRARRLPNFPPSERIDDHRVRGCLSPVWMIADYRDGRCHFRADASGPVVRALAIFLSAFFSGAMPAEILEADAIDPLDSAGVLGEISPTRRIGLSAARATIRAFAAAHAPA